MVLDVAEAAEPEDGDLVEDLSLVGDAGREDDVERGDAVGGDEQERVAEVVDVADFAAAGEWEGEGGLGDGAGHDAAHSSAAVIAPSS